MLPFDKCSRTGLVSPVRLLLPPRHSRLPSRPNLCSLAKAVGVFVMNLSASHGPPAVIVHQSSANQAQYRFALPSLPFQGPCPPSFTSLRISDRDSFLSRRPPRDSARSRVLTQDATTLPLLLCVSLCRSLAPPKCVGLRTTHRDGGEVTSCRNWWPFFLTKDFVVRGRDVCVS